MEGTTISSQLVYFLWVPVCLLGMQRWPPARATALLFIGGTLYLAEMVSFDVPGIPGFDKRALISLWVFIGALCFHRDRFSAPFPRGFKWCIGFLVIGAIFTPLTNMDDFTFGTSYLEAHRPYDIVHLVLKRVFTTILPFAIGLAMFRTSAELRVLFKTLVAIALVYSVLQVIEMIVSPQLHRWVYGYHQHSFAQTFRGGGYRPMVFMEHGLAVAMFAVLTATAAAGLQKAGVKVWNFSSKWVTGYLSLILALSRSLAAFLYGALTIPVVLFLSPKRQATVALGLAGLLMVYPAVRALGLVPVEQINEFVLEQWGVDRAGSLTVRFENEVQLLDKALERPWFGWGTFCRACIFEPWTGNLLSVRDGAWIGIIGDGGLFRFLGEFGLLVFPVFAVFRRIDRVAREADRRLLAALALMVGVSAFDLIPNGAFNALPTFFAGALSGTLTGILQQSALARRKRRAERAQRARDAREAMAT